MYKIIIALEKLVEEEINIINAFDMLFAMMKHFQRLSEDKTNNFIDSAKVFTRMREVNSETDFVRPHCHQLVPSGFDSQA